MTATLEVFRRVGNETASLAAGPNGLVCREGDTVVFHTTTTNLPRLTLCGNKLPPQRLGVSPDGYAAEFQKLIDVWAGRTTFVLHDGERQTSVQLDIGPHEGKLDGASWNGMIDELSRISTALPWGLSPGRASGHLDRNAPPAVHPAVLESQLPSFRRLLAQLLAEPPVRTLRLRALAPLTMMRRADLGTLRWLGRHPVEVAGLRGQAAELDRPNARLMVQQPIAVQSYDHPVTRYIAWLLDRIARRLDDTARALRGPAGRGVADPAASAYASELAARVEAVGLEIARVRRAPLFRNISPVPADDSVIQTLADNPLYSALHRVGRRLLDPGLAYAPGEDVEASLKNSWDLFELLVLYRLGGELGRVLTARGWREAQSVAVRTLGHEAAPANGSAWRWASPHGSTIELWYQRGFRSGLTSTGPPFTSLTGHMIPDFVIVARTPQGGVSWLILDAKFRSGESAVHEALGDLHCYRDALRIEGVRADEAFIVAPRLSERVRIYASTSYLAEHRFGALVLFEPGSLGPVTAWLERR
ncbi:MAG TPA: nuclease domain-containing protein [Caulobacteraceae bacterium]|nr:nuclease domain-containing protein [Caulobacteraceae bacterium]